MAFESGKFAYIPKLKLVKILLSSTSSVYKLVKFTPPFIPTEALGVCELTSVCALVTFKKAIQANPVKI